MKKMNAQYNKLSELMKNINDIIFDLVGKSDDIKYNAWDKGIGLSVIEQDIYDEINEQISNLTECVKYIRLAMSRLEKYTD